MLAREVLGVVKMKMKMGQGRGLASRELTLATIGKIFVIGIPLESVAWSDIFMKEV